MDVPALAAQIYAEGYRFATITDNECVTALETVGIDANDANVWALLTELTNCRLADLLTAPE